ncbi:MAG: Fic family protein [Patescibacteria group bacterium]
MHSSDSLMPKKLNPKEKAVFDFIRINNGVSNSEIAEALEPQFGKLHRNTIVGYVDSLLEKNLVVREGAGGFDVRYSEKIPNPGYKSFDVEKYFGQPSDEREVRHPFFNPDVFSLMKRTFTDYELRKVEGLNNIYLETVRSCSPAQIKREMERLTIELSWKSARIEGNTYSLIDTEVLLKQNQEAKGHEKREATEIINHKKAIDYVLENRGEFSELNLESIIKLHGILTANLDIATGVRSGGVGIVGTNYRPLGSQADIEKALRKFVELVNEIEQPIEKAFAAVMLTSYIQPFFDGNKRTARILGNGILLAHEMAPLSYRSVDEASYKKGIILFYEQNSFRYFKELFIEQFKFSIGNYFSQGA